MPWSPKLFQLISNSKMMVCFNASHNGQQLQPVNSFLDKLRHTRVLLNFKPSQNEEHKASPKFRLQRSRKDSNQVFFKRLHKDLIPTIPITLRLVLVKFPTSIEVILRLCYKESKRIDIPLGVRQFDATFRWTKLLVTLKALQI